jgi:hypothetical protein
MSKPFNWLAMQAQIQPAEDAMQVAFTTKHGSDAVNNAAQATVQGEYLKSMSAKAGGK